MAVVVLLIGNIVRSFLCMNAGTQKKLGVLLQYIQMGLSIVISFAYTPIMLRILGQAQFGIYNLSNSVISYLSLLSLGFGASYIRFYTRYDTEGNRNEIDRLNGLFMLVFLVLGGIALLAGLVLARNAHIFFNESNTVADMETAKILMVFMAVNLSLSFPTSVFTAYVTVQEHFVFQKILNMIKTVVSPLLTLPVLLMGYGSVGMVVVTTVITVIADVSNLIFCIARLEMRFDFRSPNLHLLKDIAVFSSFIALGQIVDQINWATDKVILGKLCTSATVAVYAIGAQINTYYLQFSTAISSVFIPQVNRIVASKHTEEDKNRLLTSLFTRVGRIQFILMALILTGFIIFGKYFILRWAGENYNVSYLVALLLIIPVTIPLIQNIGIEVQRAKNMHHFRSYLYLAMALTNVIITIGLSKKWGEVGAALGTAISLVLANGIVMNIYYHKKIGIDIVYFWTEIAKLIPGMIPPVLLGLLINRFWTFRTLVDFGLWVIIYILVYGISMYNFGLNDYEKQLLRKPIQKILIR